MKLLWTLLVLEIVLFGVSCSAGGRSFNVLVLEGRVEVVGIQRGDGFLDGSFTLALTDDGRFHELITLRGEDRVDEMVFDGAHLFARSFLAYPRTPYLEVNEAEAQLWRSAMRTLRESTGPEVARFSTQVPVDTSGSPLAAGAPTASSATTSIEIVIEAVEANEKRPVPKAWRRILGGTRNVPYRSTVIGGEAKQVLAFQVHTVRFETAFADFTAAGRNR